MQSIRRTCQAATSAPRLCSPLASLARRAFSQSSACERGALPQFLEASSPELSHILAQYNAKVLLPQHLTPEQQKLVYKQENRARLEAEPIEITLGDVTLPLEHIDRNRDQPARWKTIKEIVDRSKTPEDWENLVRALQGAYKAGIYLKAHQWERIVRKLCQADMHHLLLKAIQRVDKTGLRLREPGVVHQVFRGLRNKAALVGWDKAETLRMLGFAEQIAGLMENKEHLGQVDPVRGDLRTSPLVIAVPLELAAVRAKKHTDGQDRDGKVAKYASRLMKALQQDDYNNTVLSKKLSQLSSPSSQRHEISDRFHELIPLWNTLKTANQVLGSEMPSAEVAWETETLIRESLSKAQENLKEMSSKDPKCQFVLENNAKVIQECEQI